MAAVRARIALEDSVDIAKVSALHASLVNATEGASAVEIDGGRVARIDAAGIQLLCAFVEQMRRAGLDVRWVGCSATLRQTAALLDVDKTLGLTSEEGVRP